MLIFIGRILKTKHYCCLNKFPFRNSSIILIYIFNSKKDKKPLHKFLVAGKFLIFSKNCLLFLFNLSLTHLFTLLFRIKCFNRK